MEVQHFERKLGKSLYLHLAFVIFQSIIEKIYLTMWTFLWLRLDIGLSLMRFLSVYWLFMANHLWTFSFEVGRHSQSALLGLFICINLLLFGILDALFFLLHHLNQHPLLLIDLQFLIIYLWFDWISPIIVDQPNFIWWDLLLLFFQAFGVS